MGRKHDAWREIAEKELRGRAVEDLTWNTLEGIKVKPIYTEEDLEGLGHRGPVGGMSAPDSSASANGYGGADSATGASVAGGWYHALN